MPTAPEGSILVPWSTESNLGFVLTRQADPDATTIRGKFFSLVDNSPVEPDPNTRLIVLEKDTPRYEMLYFTDKTLIDADTQEYDLTGCFRNRAWQGWDLVERDVALTDVHAENSAGSTVDVHYLIAIPWSIFAGERASGGQYLFLGTGEDDYQYLGFFVDLGAGAVYRKSLRINFNDGKLEWSDNDGSTWNPLSTAGNHGTTANISAHAQMDASVDTPAQYNLMSWVVGNKWGAVDYKTAMPTATTPLFYTPGFLTGGTAAQSTPATWAALLATAKFNITIDGVAYTVNPDFTGCATMTDVANAIQEAIRILTSKLSEMKTAATALVFQGLNRRGQIIKTKASTNRIVNYTVKLNKRGTPAGNLEIKVYNVSSGLPTGAPLKTMTIAASSLSGTAARVTFNLDLPVNPNTSYAITYGVPSGTPGNDAQVASNLSLVDLYADGTNLYSSDGGVTWQNDFDDAGKRVDDYFEVEFNNAETVVWSTNHFIITSGATTLPSSVSVTSTPPSGTDISGAGASDWMDCDTGHGVPTAAVLNNSAYQNYIVLLNSLGQIDSAWLQAELQEAKAFFAATSMTGAQAETLKGGPASAADLLHTHLEIQGMGLRPDGLFYSYMVDTSASSWNSSNCTVTDEGSYVNCESSAGNALAYANLMGVGATVNPVFGNGKKINCEFRGIAANGVTGDRHWGLGEAGAFGSAYNNAGNDEACFASDGATLYAATSNGSGGAGVTNVDISAGISITSWHVYRIELIDGVSAKFYVDDALKATITTTLPNNNIIAVGCGMQTNTEDFLMGGIFISQEL